MIDHQQRHHYLEMLGIDSWLPRQTLEGAAPSDAWIWDFCSDEVAPAPERPANGNSQAASPQSTSLGSDQARARLTRSFAAPPDVAPLTREAEAPARDLEKSPTPNAIGSDVDDMAALVPDQRPVPHFKLGFIRFGGLLIIDTLPTRARSGFSAQHQALAVNIVQALNPAWQRDARPALMLPWPPFTGGALRQGYAEAVAAVAHKLKKERAQGELTDLLLMGQSAAQLALDRDESLDQLRGVAFNMAGGVKAWVTYSLSEAMQVPGIKQEIWRDLQPLYRRLQP